MRIDIIVDTVCPWCYLGKRRLERALAERPGVAVALAWWPFQLNPDMPAEGIERRAYLEAKFGGIEGAKRRYAAIERSGAEDGIVFAFDRIARTPNTLDSHRLIRFAARHGRQGETVEAVFRAYFAEGRDIGARDVLADIAAEAGLDRDAARAHLDGAADVAELVAEDNEARRLGVNGVPCFIIDRRYAVSGAQSPEVFVQVFDLVREDGVAAQ